MPKFRTPKNSRATYIYRDAYGRKIEITPGMEDVGGQVVTASHIILLHAEDDLLHNAAKRDSYHGLSHYSQNESDGDALPDDRQADLADNDADPETLFIQALEAAERADAFKAEWEALTDKQRSLVMKKLLKRSNTDIAKEEGCTEAAIRNRLSKIQKRFEKFLK